jgi:hypothetical protein
MSAYFFFALANASVSVAALAMAPVYWVNAANALLIFSASFGGNNFNASPSSLLTTYYIALINPFNYDVAPAISFCIDPNVALDMIG